jgi:hypothetical protein
MDKKQRLLFLLCNLPEGMPWSGRGENSQVPSYVMCRHDSMWHFIKLRSTETLRKDDKLRASGVRIPPAPEKPMLGESLCEAPLEPTHPAASG